MLHIIQRAKLVFHPQHQSMVLKIKIKLKQIININTFCAFF